MSEASKITPSHLRRCAFVYVRQSTPSQLERNPESRERQYALVARAIELGWAKEQVVTVDEDLGVSGSGIVERSGFSNMAAEVALGRAGIILSLEVSRLARNNADWYRLLDLCVIADTLIGDADGLYHPAAFNDRLVLGLKGTMSEAELHLLRARLEGGIKSKAAKEELRRGLPVGFVYGEEDGEVLFHPDEAVLGAIRTIFERFAELGSVRRVWLWLRSEGLSFPLQSNHYPDIVWVAPTYTAIHSVLTNPTYAGAYTYGKTKRQRYIDDQGRVRQRGHKLAQSEWEVFLPNHHPGFIDFETYEANRARIDKNIRPKAHEAGGAVREGAALLQGIATCGHCGRRLKVHYRGKFARPGYHCSNSTLVNGRGSYCMNVGGVQIDQAVSSAFLAAIAPAGTEASIMAAAELEADHDAALSQWRLEVERARYEAERAERRFLAVEPENRLVARGLEREWENKLQGLAAAEAELALREHRRPRALSPEERESILALGADVGRVWSAPSTTDRDRKELLRTLLEEVIVLVERGEFQAKLTLRWRGGAITDLEVDLPRSNPPKIKTDESTIDLIRRLAAHYPDDVVAAILNRQGRRSARDERFTATIVGGLRRYRKIPRFEPPADPPEGELLSIKRAAEELGVYPSTLHRWLNEGFIGGEQITPGAPWRIRMTDGLRSKFVDESPPGWLAMLEATMALGVSRQTVLQRVKRGELRAVVVMKGRRKGLRIEVKRPDGGLFDALARNEGAV
jgi:DNA invertase Pin-like site-specific DNA recombinase